MMIIDRHTHIHKTVDESASGFSFTTFAITYLAINASLNNITNRTLKPVLNSRILAIVILPEGMTDDVY